MLIVPNKFSDAVSFIKEYFVGLNSFIGVFSRYVIHMNQLRHF